MSQVGGSGGVAHGPSPPELCTTPTLRLKGGCTSYDDVADGYDLEVTARAERTSGLSTDSAAGLVPVQDRPTVDEASHELPVPIDGVQLRRLAIHADHRGTLVPFLDIREHYWAEPIVYAYCITVLPGRIKGWGMHHRQTDRYVTLGGNVRVVLFDGRDASPTREALSEIHFTDSTPGALLIPPGVWHATQNWGDREATIINFPTHPYDASNPDKSRIDPHSESISFNWSLQDG